MDENKEVTTEEFEALSKSPEFQLLVKTGDVVTALTSLMDEIIGLEDTESWDHLIVWLNELVAEKGTVFRHLLEEKTTTRH